MSEHWNENQINLVPVDQDNWREVAGVEVFPEQRNFVADPAYYLCLCHYGELWQPLAVKCEDKVIGFLMWAVDPADESCWLGGILIDKSFQGKGLGKSAVKKALNYLEAEHGCQKFALSYQPENPARHLYGELGFVETGEIEGEEIVARLKELPRH